MSLAEWFARERGITPETLEHFGVTFPATNTAIFPYPNGEKTRKVDADGKRRFFFTEGRRPSLFNAAEADRPVVFLVEGETDTMRLWQELRAAEVDSGVVGLSGVNAWTPELAESFANAGKVFVILDNDQDYTVRPQVDAAWKQLRHDIGSKAKRIHLPSTPIHAKDICEFFDSYDLDTLRSLAKKKAQGQSRYSPLDLTRTPPPPDWVIEHVAAKSDVNLIHGAGGLGKSWLTMGATLAVAEGWPDFLGKSVQEQGRVLYVDQENPEDVIMTRLKKLGMTENGRRNIRYLWNCGIRLDKGGEEFLEEALDFEPTLIVLDSLTRLHTQDENSAQTMAELFNNGIQPLARETGASVLLIHHDNKGGGSRGSVDITNSPDNVLQVRGFGEDVPGKFVLKQGKSRRRLGGEELIVSIDDTPDGLVKLNHISAIEAPF